MATFTVGFMKPKEVVKIRSWPSAASWRITRSASGPSLTLSTKLVSTCIAELGLDRLAADVVAIGPAMVADRADIDEADLGRIVLGRRRRIAAKRRRPRRRGW